MRLRPRLAEPNEKFLRLFTALILSKLPDSDRRINGPAAKENTMKTMPLTELETIDAKTSDYNVIVESPRGCRSKYTYEPENGLFKLSKSLPAGAVFPYDFGFIPSTLGQDGDPLDVLVFLDEPSYPGVLVTARLVGAIEAEQTEEGETVRNDRLIAVATVSQTFHNVKEMTELNVNIITYIEHFFISYNELAGKKFQPTGRSNAAQAKKLVVSNVLFFQLRRF